MYELKMMEEIYQKKQEELNTLWNFEDIGQALKSEDSLEVQKAYGFNDSL